MFFLGLAVGAACVGFVWYVSRYGFVLPRI